MVKKLAEKAEKKALSVMPGWHPLEVLWTAENTPFDTPPYANPDSAKWAVRKMRAELIEACALARHNGRVMVHPERYAQVTEAFSVQQYVRHERFMQPTANRAGA